LNAAAAVHPDELPSASIRAARHAFSWHSSSIGADWQRRMGQATVRVQGWQATTDAQADWNPPGETALQLRAGRNDRGVLAVVERNGPDHSTALGAALRQSTTFYRVGAAGAGGTEPFRLRARVPVADLFIQHEAQLSSRFAFQLRGSASAADDLHFSPQLQVRWLPARSISLTAGFAHAHQFAQSLRNPESLAANLFPADLWVGADDSAVPVARSSLGWLAGEYRIAPGLRLGGQTYVRNFTGLLLVAPRTGQPFATDGFGTGSGSAHGFSADASISGARYGVVASYGWQHVRFAGADSSYVPGHGVQHVAEGGLIVFPAATLSARLGITAVAGRRATDLAGPFEWEACNLRDRGCEFAGSPVYDPQELARTRLPGYLRVDAGLRKHWHLHLAGRDATVALFGTLTNVFGQANVLAVARADATGQPARIAMRPRAPLVVGLDWRY
jgi:hypothetical protein